MAVDTSLRIMFMQDLGTLAISWRPIFHLHISTQENACIFFLGIANWSCSPQSSFLFPLLLMVPVHMAQWCRPVCAWICIFGATVLLAWSTRVYQHIYHSTVSFTSHSSDRGVREGSGNPPPLSTHWAAPLSTGWCTKTSHPARPAHFQLTAFYYYSFIRGGLGGRVLSRQVANHSKTSLLQKNSTHPARRQSNDTHHTGFQTPNLLSLSL